ncbi:MAG: hypothetical protein ACRDPH_04560 [Marmoricola sp.]
MTPLQKIGMGLVIVLLPAYFPAHAHPPWAVYDALPDPIGWALVVAGVWALGRTGDLGLTVVKWLAVVALLVSVPMWFPQLNHQLVPKYNPGISVSFQWFLGLPQAAFGLVLAQRIGKAGQTAEPRDRYLAGRFGVLTWGFAATIVLPAVAYGGAIEQLQGPSLILIGLVNVVFIFYLFASHRRTLLGGPGPRDWTAGRPRRTRSGQSGGRTEPP